MPNITAIKAKGAEYFQRGDYEKAIKEYEKALEIEPTDAILYNNIGDSYMKLGKPGEAITYYEKAADVYTADALYNNATAVCKKILRINRDNAGIYRRLADLYAHQGLVNDAINNLLEYAERMHKEGMVEAVLSSYQKIVELSPKNMEIKEKLADLYLAEGRIEDALKEFEGILTFHQEHGHKREGDLIQSRIRQIKGEEPITQEVETPPKVSEVEPSEILGFQSGISFGQLFPEVQQGVEQEPPTVPLQEIFIPGERKEVKETVEEKPPENWAVCVELGELLWEIGSAQEACEQFHRAAEGYFQDGELERAQELYKKISNIVPLEIRTRQKLVEIALKQDNKESAVEAYLGLAECLMRRKKKEQAASVYHKVLEIAPKNEIALENLSIISPEEVPHITEEVEVKEEIIKEVTQEAKVSTSELTKEFQTVTEKKEDAGEKVTKEIGEEKIALGRELVEGGKLSHVKFSLGGGTPPLQEETISIEEIIEEFKEGVFKTVSQEDYKSHYDLGIAYRDMGLLDEAIIEFQISVKGEEEALKSLEMLGRCFLEKGEPQFAVRQFDRGLAIAGRNPIDYIGIRYYLSLALEQLKEYQRAIKELEEVYLLNSNFLDTATRLKKLREKSVKDVEEEFEIPSEILHEEKKVETYQKSDVEKPQEVLTTVPAESPLEPEDISALDDLAKSLKEFLSTSETPVDADKKESISTGVKELEEAEEVRKKQKEEPLVVETKPEISGITKEEKAEAEEKVSKEAKKEVIPKKKKISYV